MGEGGEDLMVRGTGTGGGNGEGGANGRMVSDW